VEPVLVLWAITRELRELIKLKHTQGLSQGLNTQNLWNKRQPLMVRLLSLHSEKTLYALLQRAARIDLLIKGMAVGSVWDELSSLVLSMAGIDIGAANDRA
jgi:DNA polymerase III delta subunit